jgi:hypothetical protein
MISRRHGQRENEMRLKNAGFRKINRILRLCARFALYDLAARVPRLLSKRSVSFMSRWSRGAGKAYIELSVITVLPNLERSAVSVDIRFFKFFGAEIEPNSSTSDVFFADTEGHASPQRVYFTIPEEAQWVVVRLTRQAKGRRIGVVGSLRPQINDEPLLPLDEVLASRDEYQLRERLSVAQKTCNRRDAQKILARLIYLKQRSDDIQALRIVDDLEDMVAGTGQGRVHPPLLTASDVKPFIYSELYGPLYSGQYPLSKWLMNERRSLDARRGSASLIVPAGPNRLLRCLVAGKDERMPDVENRSLTLPIQEIPWLTLRDFQAILDESTDRV